MKKVTGLGGIFFKSEDPKATNEWYAKPGFGHQCLWNNI
jgi:hypothetical protein